MPPRYTPRRSTSDPRCVSWVHICAAAKAVVQRACEDGDIDSLLLSANTSLATLKRMLRDDHHGGWTCPRLEGIKHYEEAVFGTTSIREAQVGTAADGDAGRVEADADDALHGGLTLGERIVRARPGGYSVSELRQLVPIAQDEIAKLQRFVRDGRRRMQGPATRNR